MLPVAPAVAVSGGVGGPAGGGMINSAEFEPMIGGEPPLILALKLMAIDGELTFCHEMFLLV